ncbi:MAG: FHA domain-containing protein [Myxococcota bacterium]
MGLLSNVQNGECCTLRARNLIGRSRTCDLKLSARMVSGEHATLWWKDKSWVIRDLSSRNGTFVDGLRIEPGLAVPLRVGAILAFGDNREQWRLASAEPPSAQAVSLDDGQTVSAIGELLGIPDADTPMATIYRNPAGLWVVDQDDAERPVHDRQELLIGEQLWRLHLPEPIGGTWDLDAQTPAVEVLSLHFAVSLDEEHVELEARFGNRTYDLKSRAHHYLLLTLARQRLKDSENEDLPRSAHGWVYQDDLLKMLNVDNNKLNVDIFRARKQFAAAGVEGAARIVERRTTTRQLRIGIGDLHIRQL